MTVQTFQPGQVTLHLTEAANQQALREIQRASAAGIRLDLDESGCSGFMYTLDFVESAKDGDKLFKIDGVNLYVPEKWLPMLNGLVIDYVTEGVNSLFKFRNPNATGECGCGESFTVDDV
ncbi:iron-sulfur cluster assembly accessory protein [Alcanivorax sp.]|jgi:Fe-S cluster assembly protein SufA/iron-sulfur cluster assembly protein|uniref:HesB/IscA family protein n=1 Tax=Alcanivorax sp. TaxID=1872427 RepID=UPI0032D8C6DD